MEFPEDAKNMFNNQQEMEDTNDEKY